MRRVGLRQHKARLGTLAVAAGGFTVGGLAMALGLSVSQDSGQPVQVVLQDHPGATAAPSTTPPGPTPTPTASATPRPSVTPRPRATVRHTYVPQPVVTHYAPAPVVQSTGS